MKKWEIRNIELSVPALSEELEEIKLVGEQGWELVSVTQIAGNRMVLSNLWFKRELIEEGV